MYWTLHYAIRQAPLQRGAKARVTTAIAATRMATRFTFTEICTSRSCNFPATRALQRGAVLRMPRLRCASPGNADGCLTSQPRSQQERGALQPATLSFVHGSSAMHWTRHWSCLRWRAVQRQVTSKIAYTLPITSSQRFHWLAVAKQMLNHVLARLCAHCANRFGGVCTYCKILGGVCGCCTALGMAAWAGQVRPALCLCFGKALSGH